MVYMGSKNRISKELAPIIQSYIDDMPNCNGYLKPFVGGANMIDKIKCDNKYGSDINKYLIALLKQVQKDKSKLLCDISKDTYEEVKNNMDNFDDWYVGLIGFCYSYNAKWFVGYNNNCQTKQRIRNYGEEAVRNLLRQSDSLKYVTLTCCDFRSINNSIENFVIYCDIPYCNTTQYKDNDFPYNDFYEWCKYMSKNNIVLISEYNMPDGFDCIWCKEVTTTLNNYRANKENNRLEKLFICKGEK